MEVKIVLGYTFGDEGKGVTVQWLCKKAIIGAITSHLDIPFDNVYYNDSIESNIKQML